MSKMKTLQTVILKLKNKQQQLQDSNQIMSVENKKYARQVRELEIKLEIEKEALSKRNGIQSKLSHTEAKLQRIENEYKDMQEENRKLKRINKQAEKYLGNLNKNIMTVTEDQKGSAEMQQQLDKTKQLLFKTEDRAKKREIELKDQIIGLQREFLDASSTLLKNKTIISKMEEKRINLVLSFNKEKEELQIDYENRLKENMKVRTPYMKVHVGTNTEQPVVLPRPRTASSITSLGQQSMPPTLTIEEQFQNLQLGFISDIQDDSAEEFLIDNTTQLGKENILGFFRSHLDAVIKNLIGSVHINNIDEVVVEKFVNFANVTMENNFDALYQPLKHALIERDALQQKVEKMQNDWDESMAEKVAAASTKDVLLSAMHSRRTSFSQSSCQVQTEALPLNSNETQTEQKQTREVGLQAYLFDGFQSNITKTSKAMDKRWSFLTGHDSGAGTSGFSLRGQSFMSPNTKVDPKKMKAMVTNVIKEGYEINRKSKLKLWKYFLSQYRILHFWKILSDRILPANEKNSMEKAQNWAMQRWKRIRKLSELSQKQQQQMSQQLWKISCDKALHLVRITADIPAVTPKSDRPKKSPRDIHPKKSPWDRESKRHASRDIWSGTTSPRGSDDADGENKKKKSKDVWSAVTLSYHPIDFTNIRPTNYIKVSNIHKFNKPHFDPREKRPHSSRMGKRALKKLSIQGLNGTNAENKKQVDKNKLEDAVKENSPPQRRPASARIIKKKMVKLTVDSTNNNIKKSILPPKKKQSEVGQPSTVAFGAWLEAPIPTPKSTITVMKGQIQKKERSKNTYGRKRNKRSKYKSHNVNKNSSKGGVIKNIVIKTNYNK